MAFSLWFFLESVESRYEPRNKLNELTTPTSESRPGHSRVDNFLHLTKDEIDGVQKFVYFIGYARTGHSIIGSMMDAHPNMIITHEYQMFEGNDSTLKAEDRTKTRLFNHIYKHSFQESRAGLRTADRDSKGYSLDVPGAWQGRFQTLKVIGNKFGGGTTFLYGSKPKAVQKFFHDLRTAVQVPLAEIYVVRNPFDIISTAALYMGHRIKYGWKGPRLEASPDDKYKNTKVLEERIRGFFRLAHALKEMIETCSLDNVLMLRIEDFIQDPKAVIRKICDHLDLECPLDYVELCYNKTFKEVSRSRDSVYWPERLRESVVQQMSEFPEFVGYTFENDYYVVS